MWSLILASLFAVGQNVASPTQPDSMGFIEVASWPFGSTHALAEDTINNLIFLASGAGVIVLQPDPYGGFNFVSDAIRTHGGNINVLVYDYSRHLLFMGGDNAWLEVWSVSAPSNPAKITAYQDAVPYSYSDIYIMDMHLLGNYLIVGYENVNGSSHYVKIFNTNNLPDLQQVATVPVQYPINNISLDGNRMFVNTSGSSFVFDISNISSPDSIGYLPVGNCFGIAEDTVFYAVWGSWNGIYGVDIYNISNLSNPVLIGQGNFPLARTYHKVRKYGNTIYACGELLDTWDVSDLTNPSHMWSFWARSTGIYDFSLDNGMLLTASGNAGLSSIVFDTLGNPIEGQFFRTPGISLGNISSGDGLAFYFSRANGDIRLDILSFDQYQGSLSIPISVSNGFSSAYSNSNLYVTSDTFLTRIDVSNPSTPEISGMLRLPHPISSKRALVIDNGYAYVGSDSGFYVVSTGNMQLAGSLSDTAFSYGWNQLYIYGNYIYMVSRYNKLGVVDISNPASPQLVFTTNFTQLYGGIQSIAFYNNYAYVSTNVSQIMILDVSNPTNPTYVSDVPSNDRTYALRELTVRGNYLFGTNNSYSAMVAFDLSNPTAPEVAGYYDNYYNSNTDYTIDGENIYLANWTIGIHILHFTPTGISEGPGLIFKPDAQVTLNTLKFYLQRDEHLSLKIYNSAGRVVIWKEKRFSKGVHAVSLKNLKNGVYFYIIKTHRIILRGRVLVIR